MLKSLNMCSSNPFLATLQVCDFVSIFLITGQYVLLEIVREMFIITVLGEELGFEESTVGERVLLLAFLHVYFTPFIIDFIIPCVFSSKVSLFTEIDVDLIVKPLDTSKYISYSSVG